MTIIRKRLYRLYYNTFSDDTHRKILDALRERFGSDRVVDHTSKVHPEFRYIEIRVETPGLEGEIEEIVKSAGDVFGVKVDWIEIRK